MARRFTGVLKTVSVGKNENRQLTIRKVQSVAQLVRNVLLESGGENNKYRVYLPGKWPMLKYFPDPSVVTVEGETLPANKEHIITNKMKRHE